MEKIQLTDAIVPVEVSRCDCSTIARSLVQSPSCFHAQTLSHSVPLVCRYSTPIPSPPRSPSPPLLSNARAGRLQWSSHYPFHEPAGRIALPPTPHRLTADNRQILLQSVSLFWNVGDKNMIAFSNCGYVLGQHWGPVFSMNFPYASVMRVTNR